MSKHDIRLRRQKFMARGPDRFRDYSAVLERHGKEMRIKKVVRVFTYLFIILIIVMMIVIVVRVEKKVEKKKSSSAFFQDDKKLVEVSV